jgi:hypothetical protein
MWFRRDMPICRDAAMPSIREAMPIRRKNRHRCRPESKGLPLVGTNSTLIEHISGSDRRCRFAA